jgi:hypothetical protein
MKTILHVTLIMLLSLVLLVACGEPAAMEPPAEPATVEIVPTQDPITEEEEKEMEEKENMEREETDAFVPDELTDLVEEMKDHLSERANVNHEAITVVKVESVIWNDGSLGCPQPDQMYTMAQEPGYRLVLTAAGREFYYHTRGTSYFIQCNMPQAPELLPEQ